MPCLVGRLHADADRARVLDGIAGASQKTNAAAASRKRIHRANALSKCTRLSARPKPLTSKFIQQSSQPVDIKPFEQFLARSVNLKPQQFTGRRYGKPQCLGSTFRFTFSSTFRFAFGSTFGFAFLTFELIFQLISAISR